MSSMSSTANMTRCVPTMLCGRSRGPALIATGLQYFANSIRLCPSGVRTIEMSQRRPSSPVH